MVNYDGYYYRHHHRRDKRMAMNKAVEQVIHPLTFFIRKKERSSLDCSDAFLCRRQNNNYSFVTNAEGLLSNLPLSLMNTCKGYCATHWPTSILYSMHSQTRKKTNGHRPNQAHTLHWIPLIESCTYLKSNYGIQLYWKCNTYLPSLSFNVNEMIAMKFYSSGTLRISMLCNNEKAWQQLPE